MLIFRVVKQTLKKIEEEWKLCLLVVLVSFLLVSIAVAAVVYNQRHFSEIVYNPITKAVVVQHPFTQERLSGCYPMVFSCPSSDTVIKCMAERNNGMHHYLLLLRNDVVGSKPYMCEYLRRQVEETSSSHAGKTRDIQAFPDGRVACTF